MMRESQKSNATVMRHPIWIQSIVRVADGMGGHKEYWQDVKKVFAAVDPIMAKQVFEFRSLNNEATHRIKMHGFIDINKNQRIKFGSRLFEILVIENIQERDFLKVVTVKERT